MASPARRIFTSCILLLVSWLIFAYPWQRLFTWSQGLNPLSLPTILIIWFLPIALFIIWMKKPTHLNATLGQLSVNWLGISFMFTLAAAIIELLKLSLGFPQQNNSLLVFFLIGIALCLYAIYKATRIEVIPVSIQSAKLRQRYKLAHLSDIHLGSRSQHFVRKVIRLTNQLKPDIVVITGDLIDMRKVKPESLHVLKEFNAPVYFIKGNHERYIGSCRHFEVIDETGVITLDDSHHLHKELQIIGIADADNPKRLEKTLATLQLHHQRFLILLYHKPEKFDCVAEKKIDLMLSGHTHAGQIFPFNLIVKRYFPLLKGLHMKDDSHLYISQGTGTWGPVMRLGSRNEIALITLGPG